MADAIDPEASKKKPPLKMLIVLGVVMLVEGLAIAGAFMLAGGPSDVEATTQGEDAESKENQPYEVIVISGKFQNTLSGQPFLYDAEIYITVKRKYALEMSDEGEEEPGIVPNMIAGMEARINSEVTTIFRRAQPAHLNEPDRQTIKRQLKAALNDLLGQDPDGEPYVLDVIVPNMTRFSTDI